MKFFSTDGIRSHSEELLTSNIVFNLGQIIGKKAKRVIVGQDTRSSSSLISTLLINGLVTQGCDVDYVNLSTSPMISYITKNNNYDYGFMITASHNPYFDNGIKVFSSNGEKISQEEIEFINQRINLKEPISLNVKLGNLRLIEDRSYLDFINSKIDFKNYYKVAIDLSFGGGVIFKDQLKLDSIEYLSYQYNGKNINDHVGATHPLYLQDYLLSNNLDYGFCFDGDGDRLILVTKEKIYDGDDLLYFLNSYYKCDKVVVTKNSNRGLIRALEKENVEVIISNVGDQNVLRKMKEENAFLGGESSGHILYLDYQVSDSLYNLVEVLRLLNLKLIPSFEKDYLINFNLPLNRKNNQDIIEKLNLLVDKEDGLLIRESGTEECIRIQIQSSSQKRYLEYQNFINNMEKA